MTIPDAIRRLRAAADSPDPVLALEDIEALGVVLGEMERTRMRRYRLRWSDGRTEVLDGRGPGDALTGAGYGPGALDDLSGIEEVQP